jgi:hypothetical protein
MIRSMKAPADHGPRTGSRAARFQGRMDSPLEDR